MSVSQSTSSNRVSSSNTFCVYSSKWRARFGVNTWTVAEFRKKSTAGNHMPFKMCTSILKMTSSNAINVMLKSTFFGVVRSENQFERCMGCLQGYLSLGPRKFLAASHSSSMHLEGLTNIASL